MFLYVNTVSSLKMALSQAWFMNGTFHPRGPVENPARVHKQAPASRSNESVSLYVLGALMTKPPHHSGFGNNFPWLPWPW